MALKKKLFPKKGKDKDNLVVNVKKHIRTLQLRSRNYQKRAETARRNASIAIKRGEKERAKNFLIQYKIYQQKVDRNNKIQMKFERQIEAIEEGIAIQQSGAFEGKVRDTLKDIASKASPVKVAEVIEETETYIAEIEESGDIIAGEPEIDYGIDIEDELNQLETEVLMDSGTMPDIPLGDELQYITDDLEDIEPDVKSKDRLKEEIEKLKKELDV